MMDWCTATAMRGSNQVQSQAVAMRNSAMEPNQNITVSKCVMMDVAPPREA